ncbi:hypothetical protein RJ640_014526 [Escallonia rubra]|uniref:APO domain-containing protein n=1 Tax=Escallonia rubra TaxID=112253 RepID=A0AA88U976_9ASTE|nr:hypothetical protein RJ640_014526 [Escallonia rubra]
MRGGANKLMKMYPVRFCGYGPEVHVGPYGHKAQNCRAHKHQQRNGQHGWQTAVLDDLIPPRYMWHVPDLGEPVLKRELRNFYGQPLLWWKFACKVPHISTVSSSHEAWERLLVLFANKSRSRVMCLKERLLNNPRGTRSIPEYLQHMRAIADDLALIDNPLSEDDLVLYTLGGLGPEFKEIAAAIRARDTSISFDELYDKLGDYELHLKKEDPIPSPSIATANYTHRSNRFTPRNSSINGSASAGRHSNHFHPRNTDHSPSHPNSNQNNWSSSNTQHRMATPRSSLYCRFCDRPGHATNECRKLARFLRENDVQTNLDLRFSLKDLGPLHHFLGVEVIPTPGGLFLSQHRHINDLLNNFSMTGAKEVNTPMCTSSALTLHDGSSHVDPTPYRKLVGALQYLSLTRPDVCFAVNRLSQFMHSPTALHWTALKRILRYLKATIHHGLYLRRGTPLTLQAFSDSDWGGDRDNGRSTTGYILYLGTNPISWKSTRQKSVSRSSSEAEYKAIANCTAEILWVTNLLHELGITLPQPPTLFCDNTGATYLCANPIFHSRMKHIALDYHFVRECVTNDSLCVHHINTKDQLADILTKALNRQQFLHLRAKIGVTNGASILRGRFDFDSAAPPGLAWRKRLNGHASILKEFSITFTEATKMETVLAFELVDLPVEMEWAYCSCKNAKAPIDPFRLETCRSSASHGVLLGGMGFTFCGVAKVLVQSGKPSDHDKTMQDKTRQDKTMQDKTR